MTQDKDLFGNPIDDPREENWKTRLINFKVMKSFSYVVLLFNIVGFFGGLYSPIKWMSLFFGGNVYFILAYLKSRELLDKYIRDNL